MEQKVSQVGFKLHDLTLRQASSPGKNSDEPKLHDDTLILTADMKVKPQSSETFVAEADEKLLERPGKTDTSVTSEVPPPPSNNVGAPLTMLAEETGVTAVEGPAPTKTLAQLAQEVSARVDSSVEAAQTPSLEPPEASTSDKIGLARRIGRGLLNFVAGDPLKVYKQEAQKINELEADIQKELKTPEDFKKKKLEFQKRLENGESLEDLRPEAYAVAREAARLTTDMRAYDVQVQGALAMDGGHIAEMKTGEGKTLAAVMPLYLNALAGKGAHLVTVNGTLASRDAEWMGPAFEMLGMTVGTVLEDMSPEEKRAGYAAEITYTTDRCLGFDYLRDRTAKHPQDRVQREPFFALIDEVDEILIDEARTPLIISGMGEPSKDEYLVFNEVAKTLVPGDDYYTEPKHHTVWLTDTGVEWVENQLMLRELDKLEANAGTPEEKLAIQIQRKQCQEYGAAIRAEQQAENVFHDAQKQKPQVLQTNAGRRLGQTGIQRRQGGSRRGHRVSRVGCRRNHAIRSLPGAERAPSSLPPGQSEGSRPLRPR